MRKLTIPLAFFLAFVASLTAAQVPFPQTLPANTVYGRLGVGSGPGQAIPFSVLTSNLFGSLCRVGGSVPIYNGTTALWQCSTDASTPDRYVFESSGGTTQPIWDFIDNNTWAGSGGILRFSGKDTNGVGQVGAVINGGLADKTAGAFKGDIDLVVFGPAGAVQAEVALTGASSPPGWLPGTDNAYQLGSPGQRWQSLNAMTGVLSTSATSPIYNGGAAANSTLTLRSTSGAGTTDFILLQTASQVTAQKVFSSGGVNFGGATDPGSVGSVIVPGAASFGTGAAAGAFVDIKAGSTVVAPLHIATGTNLTTPVAGSVEYDGKAGYFTPNGTNRGVAPAEHICVLSANFTLTNGTAAQKAFNCSTNGQLNLPASTSYEFEAVYLITNTGTTAHTWSTLFGGTATFTSLAYSINSRTDAAAAPSATNVFQGYATAATAVVVTASSTSATENVVAVLKGVMRINGAGTIIPQVQLSAAPGGAQTMLANSYFRAWPIGDNNVATVGNWN